MSIATCFFALPGGQFQTQVAHAGSSLRIQCVRSLVLPVGVNATRAHGKPVRHVRPICLFLFRSTAP